MIGNLQFEFDPLPPAPLDPVDAAIARTLPLLDRDGEILLLELQQHRGHKSPVGIASLQVLAPRLSARQVKHRMKELIEQHGIPLGASRQEPAGYFLIITEEDRRLALRPLLGEFHSLLRRIRAISSNKAVQQLLGQAQIEFTAALKQ